MRFYNLHKITAMKSTKIFLSLALVFLVTGNIFAQKYNLLIGTYTNTGKSEGLYLYEFDAATGKPTAKSKVKVQSPNFLALSNNNKFVYTIDDPRTNTNGGLNAYAFNSKSGDFKLINHVSVNAVIPCHVTVDDKNSHVFVSNYGSGSLSVHRINKDGSLGDAQVIQHKGSSVNKSRQDQAHTHSSIFSPNNKQLFVSDLGMDKILVYQYNRKQSLPVTINPAVTHNANPGVGPRHFTFHPNKKLAYSLHEISGSVEVFSYDKKKLKSLQIISTAPDGFTGAAGSADIHTSPDGKFLYASNRGDLNDIAIFSIRKDGRLTQVGRQSTLGKTPRNFAIDPTGNYLLAANQGSDVVIIFKRDKTTGLLTDTGERIQVGAPSCLVFGKID
jgi:6-phosphogluconolactonase